jgi:hypothetical protein
VSLELRSSGTPSLRYASDESAATILNGSTATTFADAATFGGAALNAHRPGATGRIGHPGRIGDHPDTHDATRDPLESPVGVAVAAPVKEASYCISTPAW